ncbi:MAG: tetratricopeptide repeat protein [Ignavibacteria bacterium]|nr:tetratricopeptide repeat protein [Ignavibacteria bacterium]
MKKILLIFIFLYLLPITILSQGAAEEKYRLAESYEKSGDFNNSSRIYEELFNQNPRVEKYFLGLARSFKQQSRYSELLPYVDKRLEYSKTIETLSLKAELLWQLGDYKEANQIWAETLELGRYSIDAFTCLMQSQISLRLFDKAIATIENARSSLKDNLVFADELSQLYIATGNFSKGAVEILNFFEKTNNLPQTQGRLQALMSDEAAISYISDLLKKKKTSAASLNYLRLYAWFLRAINDFDSAFDIYISIDEKQKSNGREILRFAEDSRADEQLEVALKAFSYLIKLGKACPYHQNALYGYSRTLEAKLKDSKEITNEFLADIIKQYKKIAEDYPNSNIGFDSRYRIAFLYFEYMNKPDEAVKELNAVINNLAAGQIAATAKNLLGQIYISQNKLSDAKNIFFNVISTYRRSYQLEVEFAEFELGELYFFEGNIDSAKVHYGNAAINLKSLVSNDALQRIILIESNADCPDELISFAKAEFFEKQRKFEDAANVYRQLASSSPQSECNLSELSLLRLANISRVQLNPEEERAFLLQLVQKFSDSIFMDLALLSLANSFYLEGNNDEALRYYTEILNKFPRSIYLTEVRDKIRKIRAGLKM